MAIKKWIAVDDGGTTKILIDNDPAKTSVYEIELLEPDDTAQVATLGGWIDLNDAVTNKGIRNAFYKVEDMAGVEGYADNESSLVHVDGTGKVYLPKEKIFSKAADSLRIELPQERTYTTSATPGTTPSLTFGDISVQDQRDLFMDNVNAEQEYSFKVGAVVHRGTILSKVGDGTNPTDEVIVEGQRLIDGKIQTFKLKVAPTGIENEIYIPMVASGYEYETIKLPAAYIDIESMPKAAIEQMILNNNALIATDASDPTWGDLDGTQTTTFNASQITIDLDGSGLVENDTVQFLLGSSGGTMVLDGSIKIYGNVADAARNGNVAGQYKWYAYAVSATEVKFVMEDSKGTLTNEAQTIAKFRRVSPDLQKFTAHYTSQADVLKGAVNITGVNTGASQEITLPAGLTTDNLTGIALTVSGSTDWYGVEGWDKVTAFYISVTNEASNQVWWVEYKIEAVPGDKTKLKITNFKSGNVGTDNAAYNAHWIAFKGGK